MATREPEPNREGATCGPPEASILSGLRLLIVTPEIHGPYRNGGIGTAFSALALRCAQAGAAVSVAYIPIQEKDDAPLAPWIESYRKRGVALLPLTGEAAGAFPSLEAPFYRCRAWRVHHWLRGRARDFDVAIFPEWSGLAYYVLLAKGQGLAYEALPVVVNAHSPNAWTLEANRQLPDWQEYVDLDFMERECVRRADRIVSPSRWLLEWMRSHRWEIPSGRACVIPNLMPAELRAGARSAPRPQPVRRLVFFGRLEMRKGLKLFCDAISSLDEERRRKLDEIVFLGSPRLLSGGMDSRSYIRERAANWGLPVEIGTDKNRDEAVSLLQSPGTLAVIPSLAENSPYTVLECLTLGIPFLASKVGGIPEMIPPEEHQTYLCEPAPQPLTDLIAQALTHGVRPASLAWDHATVEAEWLSLLRETGLRKNVRPTRAEAAPLVSVCLVHYNRPRLLAQAIESIRTQTYPNIEVVLVDDGSPSPEAQSFLADLQKEFEPRGWRIVRQPNLYLGAARNRAAREAKGAFLLFLDDDNLADPRLVETLVDASLESGAEVMTCAVSFFEGDEPPSRHERLWIPLGGAVGPGVCRNAYGDATALWRREAFWRIGGYTTDYGLGFEDWELFAEAVLSGLRLETVPEPLLWYRVEPGSMIRTTDSGANHARSVRPYLRHDPQGLGLALAHNVFLYLERERTEEERQRLADEGRSLREENRKLCEERQRVLEQKAEEIRAARDELSRIQRSRIWRLAARLRRWERWLRNFRKTLFRG